MKKQFQFSGASYEAFSNEKIYWGHIQFVSVGRVGSYGTTAKGEWDHESKSWQKQPGGAAFNEAVAKACDFIKEEPAVDCRFSFGKYQGKKLSEVPVSYLRWLVSHKMVLKPENRKVVEIVKAFLSQNAIAKAA